MLFLDENPIECVRSTPFTLYEHILRHIKMGYEELMKNPSVFERKNFGVKMEDLYVLVAYDMKLGKRNRDWLVQYYNTMSVYYQKISGKNYGAIRNDYLPARGLDSFLTAPLDIHSPMLDNFYLDIVLKHGDIYKNFESNIDISRVLLLQLDPTEEEFQYGLPTWYSEAKGQDFIAFDQTTRRYIKISKRDGNFKYYTSFISDNWREIKDVPKEMDYIINFLISTKDLTLTDQS